MEPAATLCGAPSPPTLVRPSQPSAATADRGGDGDSEGSAGRVGSKLCSLAWSLVAAAVPLTYVFYSIHIGHACRTVYLCQICLALGALQQSWWHYRIRQRFLAPLDTNVVAVYGTTADPERRETRTASAQYERMLQEKMEPTTYAMAKFAEKWLGGVKGATALTSLAAAAMISGVATAVAVVCERTVVACAVVGSFFGVMCACYAPTVSDGVGILVHQTVFTVSTMNTMIAHYANPDANPEVLDYLLLALMGLVAMVVVRFVACKQVIGCFFMILLDVVAMLHLTVITMEFVDFVDHPNANKLPNELASFFITVSCAELGHFLFDLIATETTAKCCGRSNGWVASTGGRATDFGVAMIFSMTGILGWKFFVNAPTMDGWYVAVLTGAAALSQMGRPVLAVIHETAMVPPGGRLQWLQLTLWNNGVMELINPYLLGWIVYHPYSKSILEAAGTY